MCIRDRCSGVGEECGVFGIYDLDGGDVALPIYYGLCALQHRGQETCGIAVSDTSGERGNICYHKDLGLVSEVFKAENLEKLRGNLGVGHVRYLSLIHIYQLRGSDSKVGCFRLKFWD